jgi:uroporphyrinogen-III synthase
VRLLVTRPEPAGERTAALLRTRGHDVLVAALLRVEVLADADLGPGPWAGLIVTSANAARALAAHPRRAELMALPLFAVGRRSAEAARAVGVADVVSADGDARDLVRLVAARRAAATVPLLYLAGADRAVDLAAELSAHGIPLRTVVVYRTVEAAAFPAPVRAALAAGALDGVLHFSRRSAEAFVACAQAAGLRERALASAHYCLSAQVAKPLAAAGAGRIHVSPRPDEAALLDLLPPGAPPMG